MLDRIRIAIVDDHPIFRSGILRIFERIDTIEVVAEGESADDALKIVREYSLDVCLIDVNMPGDGLLATRQIVELFPTVKVILLTMSESEDHLSKAFDCGASGYVLKGVVAQDLVSIVQDVHNGATYATPDLTARMLKRRWATDADAGNMAERLGRLTQDEIELNRLVSQGLTNKQIARELDLSGGAVKWRLSQIMRKLSVSNRTAVAIATSKQRVDLPPAD